MVETVPLLAAILYGAAMFLLAFFMPRIEAKVGAPYAMFLLGGILFALLVALALSAYLVSA